MSFLDIVRRAKAYLVEQGRVSLRALKREFDLDDDALEELVDELVDVQQVAARQGKVVSWIGDASKGALPGGASAVPSTTNASESPAASIPARGERRHLTVLFCDLVDSTRIAASLDPEDWHAVVRRYQERASEVVARFDGHVAQYLGDGLLIYFGWPRAHEDDAERSVRAGLGIVDAIRDGNAALREERAVELAVRVGIHTGPAVVGEVGRGVGREMLAMGETTNVAARLQGVSQPDTVVISEATLGLVSGIFVTRDLGDRELKGLGRVRHFEAVQPSGVRSRLDVAAARGLTPLVGRDQEIGLLEDRWQQVGEGRGQVVLVNGEAGIGKSRLMQAFRERLASRPHTWLECRASPYTQDNALYPVLELQRNALGISASDPPARNLARLEVGLGLEGFDRDVVVPIFAAFHGIALPERYAPHGLSSEGLRSRTLELLSQWLILLSRQQPVVLLVEDLHWLDPSSLELIGRDLEGTAVERVMMLLTHRPDFEPRWGARSNLTPMLLARLTREQLVELIRKAARDRTLPIQWLDEIVRRSDGVPLFAEELTRVALESNLPEHDEGDSPDLHIPETLQDSLMARLDALGPVKELAQLGSVLGREFDYELLLAVTPLKEEALRRALELAENEELFYRRGRPPNASYLFKHALLRDAAYQSLLRQSRRRTHGRVAEALIDRMPALAKEQPGLVGHHFAEAGDPERAIPHLQQAAEEAAARSANAEAVRHFEKALGLLDQLEDGPERKRRELVLQVGIGAPLQLVHGYRTPETDHAYTRALALCREVGGTAELSQALWGLYSSHLVGSHLDVACELGEQLLEVGKREHDATLEVLGHLALGVPAFFGGHFAQALEHLEQSISRYDVERDRDTAYRYGQDPCVMAMSFAAFSRWFLGQPAAAMQTSDELLALARDLRHPFTNALAHAYTTLLHLMMRDQPAALTFAEATIAIATEQAFPLWRGFGGAARARALAELGSSEDCVAIIQTGLADVAATGTVASGPYFVGLLAETQALAGQRTDALGALEMAMNMAESTGCHYWDAELRRCRGEWLLIQDDSERSSGEAQQCFEDAMEVARHQGAIVLELRAAVSLAHLWQTQDNTARARMLLEPLIRAQTDPLPTPDIQQAQSLLEQLP